MERAPSEYENVHPIRPDIEIPPPATLALESSSIPLDTALYDQDIEDVQSGPIELTPFQRYRLAHDGLTQAHGKDGGYDSPPETAAFKYGMDHPLLFESSDGVPRNIYIIQAEQPGGGTWVNFQPWSITNAQGLGRDYLNNLHHKLPDQTIVAMSNIDTDTPWPGLDWYFNSNLEATAFANSEILVKLAENDLLDPSQLTLSGASMGGTNTLLTAAFLNHYFDITAEKLIPLCAAGFVPMPEYKMLKNFVLPEGKSMLRPDQFRQASAGSLRKLGRYVSMLTKTLTLDPHDSLTLARQGIQLTKGPLQKIVHDISPATSVGFMVPGNDFVAQAKGTLEEFVVYHPNSRIFLYPGEYHLTLARPDKMAERVSYIQALIGCMPPEKDQIITLTKETASL